MIFLHLKFHLLRLKNFVFHTVLFVAFLFFGIKYSFSFQVIRDAESEKLIDYLISKVIVSSNLDHFKIKGYLVDDPSFNAFVMDNNHIFVNTGAIMYLEEAEEFMGIVAHEFGHISDMHIARRSHVRQDFQKSLIFTTIAGIAAGIASPTAGFGLAYSGVQFALRKSLYRSRVDEVTADILGAKYLEDAKVDPVYILKAFQKLSRDYMGGKKFPYLTTHPYSDERVRNLESLVARSSSSGLDLGDEFAVEYARLRAKINAFSVADPDLLITSAKRHLDELYTKKSVATGKDIFDIEYEIENTIYALAIAYNRVQNTENSINEMDRLLDIRGDYPYYHEMKGQFLFKIGRFEEAISAYEMSVKLAPDEGLVLASLGELVYMSGHNLDKAIEYLSRASIIMPDNFGVREVLARAYAQNGDLGLASLISAERFLLIGQPEFAKFHAKKAEELLPVGHHSRIRARDLFLRSSSEVGDELK